MKGLLLKDFYMAAKYLRAFYIVIVVFLATSVFANNAEYAFFSVFPMVLAGLSSITLLSYEEHSKWNIYSNVLPVSRKMLVSEKYIWVLVSVVIMSILSRLAHLISMSINGNVVLSGVLGNIALFMSLGLIGPSIMLPFIFRFGVEKGRIVYYIVAGVLCGGSTMIATGRTIVPDVTISAVGISVGVLIIAIVLYLLSWFISIKLYEKREL